MIDSVSKLAILGGRPLIAGPLPPYPSMGPDELQAVETVVRSGCLSGFFGSSGPEFLGGPMVREFEDAWARRFGVRHAISMNSATSGLIAALGAVGVGPGDEVIVPPYTMSATAVAPLIYGGIPVFADVEPTYFGLDTNAVRSAITARTKAIVAVDLFGHPAALGELRALADEHGIALVEDAAQAPFAAEDGHYCGTVGHIGVFSLNYHKHIHTGEGGMCVTNDERLAQRLRLIRNHGENVVESMGLTDLVNLVGFNFRMTELSAAIGIAQLNRAEHHVRHRVTAAERLTEAVSGLEGIVPPAVRSGCDHVYYVWTFKIDAPTLGISRQQFSQALAAEGVPHGVGYVRPLYLLPLFQQRIAIGRAGYPFSSGNPDYRPGLCPVTERLHDSEVLVFEICSYDMTDEVIDQVASAIRRVHASRALLHNEPQRSNASGRA